MYLLLKLGSPCNTKPLCYIELSKCENLDHSSQKNARTESKSILALLCIVMCVNTKVTGLNASPCIIIIIIVTWVFTKAICLVYQILPCTSLKQPLTYVKVAQLGRSTYM